MNIFPYLSKKYLIFGVGTIVIFLLGIHLYQTRQFSYRSVPELPAGAFATSGQNVTGQSTHGSEASSSIPAIKVEGTGSYKLEVLPSVSTPALNRSIVFPANFPDEAKKIMSGKIAASIAALKKDPTQANEWLALAIFRKTIDDFAGAAEIWEFLAAVNPKEPIPFANLANLYAFDLKDPVKAEKNFTLALAKWSKEAVVYRQAYEFYRFVQKDDAKAKAILTKGIAETGSQDLKYLLDHYSQL